MGHTPCNTSPLCTVRPCHTGAVVAHYTNYDHIQHHSEDDEYKSARFVHFCEGTDSLMTK